MDLEHSRFCHYLQVAMNALELPELKPTFPEITPFAEIPVTSVSKELGTEITLKVPFAYKKLVEGSLEVLNPTTTLLLLIPTTCVVPAPPLG